jgi:hypothetical protein
MGDIGILICFGYISTLQNTGMGKEGKDRAFC